MKCLTLFSEILCYSFCVPLSPAGHGPSLSDGITPQVETHTDDGAGQEDGEHHQGADQQVEEGIEDGAAGKQKNCLIYALFI